MQRFDGFEWLDAFLPLNLVLPFHMALYRLLQSEPFLAF